MSDRIRVCMLSYFFPPSYSGSALQAQALSRSLMEIGVEPTIVSANLTGSAASEMLDGVPVRRLPILKARPMQVPSFELSLATYLWRNRQRFDIVHAHGAVPHGIAGPVTRRMGRKSILKIAMANSDIAFDRQGRMWGAFNRWCAQRFDRYVATSIEARDECLAAGFPPHTVRLIPNGVDTARFRPASSEAERSRLRASLGMPGGPLVCFVGILDARKNVDGVLRVWARTRARAGCGHLALIGPEAGGADGGDGAFSRGLRAYVAAHGLGDSVTFAGRRDDVPDWLRCANVFFFPSRREGMPNVVLEAMASGLACVITDIGGSADLVEDRTSGRVFPLEDEEGMANCLAELVREPALTAALGAKARRHAEERLSLQVTARCYAALYRELRPDV